jgi:anti-sigma factor RsiW
MEDRVQCAESLRLQAYFDGELDAVSAAGMEGHLEHCPECRALLADLEQLRAALRREVARPPAPAGLRMRIGHALDGESVSKGRTHPAAMAWRKHSFWGGALAGVCGTAAAAGVAFLLLMPPAADPMLDDLVSAHIRSLMPSHLIDVVSTDQHTVKPWFAGHADVSPVVADFEPQGYRLLGGRADYFEHQRAAVVVYQHGAHLINVFSWVWDGHGLPKNTTRNGYHLAFWRMGNLAYCAVTDAGWGEVSGLTALLQTLGARDIPR